MYLFNPKYHIIVILLPIEIHKWYTSRDVNNSTLIFVNDTDFLLTSKPKN